MNEFASARRRVCAAVPAANFLYKLCGSSQPSIIQGEDGAFYVVKFNGFPGHQSLANEVIGTELIQLTGLPAPDWVPIAISSDFIERNPGLWFCTGGSPIKPVPGLHFGSRLIEASGEQRTYQMIPHSWIDRIENRADFLGMLVLDLWANNCDRRQAVFLSDARSRLRAYFIDNDFMFGGKFGFELTCPRRAMVYDLDIYRGVWSGQIMKQWLQKFDGISENTILRVVASVPEEWANGKLRRDITGQLRARRAILPRLLNDAENVLSSGFSVQYHKTRYATEPGSFRVASILPALP
jgi:hypothetical protein